MATYYRTAPQQTRIESARPIVDEASMRIDDDGQITLLDLQRSIYVFPSPSSAPPSPQSMVSSIPSDYSGTLSGSSRPGSREHSLSFSSTNSRNTSARGRTADGRADASLRHVVVSGRTSVRHTPATSDHGMEGEIDVEVWDWSRSDSGSDEYDSWELQAEVERIGRWGMPLQSQELWANASPSLARSRPLAVTIPYRYHALHDTQNSDRFYFRDTSPGQRSRTESHASSSTGAGPSTNLASAFSSSFRLSAIQYPQPRVHIPLLSFIASLFSLDLDDPALRLLTSSNSTSDSVLFPGHGALFFHDTKTQTSDDEDSDSSSASVDDDAEELSTQKQPEPHGFLRLLVTSNDSRSSMRTLRDGLAAVSSSYSSASSTLPASPFSLPSIGSVFGLCKLVGDACLNSGKAWRELRS